METKPKRAKNLIRLEKDPLVGKWLKGYKAESRKIYRSTFNMFLKWAKKTPKEMIAERKADLKKEDVAAQHQYERLVLDCFREKKAKSASSAFTIVKAVRAFFGYHYMPLKFRRLEAQEFSKGVKPVYTDYLPTREDLKAMVEVANVRDRAIMLTLASTGISGDVCELTRRQFEDKWGKEEPICLAPRGDYMRRTKTGVRMRPFLTHDAAHATKVYLKTRKDDSPWLFVDKGGEKLTSEALNKLVHRLAEKAAIPIPEGQRIRMHCFRKFFNEAANNADVTREWICVLYGHEIAGSEDFYVTAAEDKLREKFKRIEPHLSVSRITNMVIIRNQFAVALDEQAKQQYLSLLQLVGKERFEEMARYHLAMQPMIKWDPEKEIEPAIYRTQRILREILGPRKRKRGA
ncbi:Tyrosine recombinase XerD [subsurface metagenome]